MPTPTYTALANITLGSSASSVTFSSIPATYRDLIVVCDSIGSGDVLQFIHFNSDFTNSNYSSVRMYGTGSGSGASDSANSPRIGNSFTTKTQTAVQVMDYSATDKHKSYLARNEIPASLVMAEAGRWANTAAITAIRVSPNGGTYNSGSTFALYGIAS